MSLRAFLPLWLLLGVPSSAPRQEAEHGGSFEGALAHHSTGDLSKWREAHPWSLGDAIATFFDGLLETRKVGERLAIERADLQAAFLVEAIAEDPFSGWILEVRSWDAEACSHHETVISALATLPEMIAAGEKDAAWKEIADLRDDVAPKGGWALCAPAVARCAAAFFHAGDREHARQLATGLATSAEERRQGSVVVACERMLGELARESGSLAECGRRTARCFEIAGGLDPAEHGGLLAGIEGLEACDVDTLLEISSGEQETLVLATGSRGGEVALLPLGRDWIAERTKRCLKAAPFDEAAARELYDQLLRPVEGRLGARLGIVTDLPLELFVAGGGPGGDGKPPRFLARDHEIVRFSSAPIGALVQAPRPEAARGSGTLVIAGRPGRSEVLAALDRATSSPFAPVRTIRAKVPGDWAKEAAGAKLLHFDGFEILLPLDTWRDVALRADLAVVADCGPGSFAALAGKLHGAGVRDVLGNLGSGSGTFLARFYEHLAQGQPVPEALRAARAELIDAPSPQGHPRAWAAWVLHRRS